MLILAATLLGACAREEAPVERAETDVDETQGDAGRSFDSVFAAHASELMAIPGVVGVAQGATADGKAAFLVMLAREDAVARARIPDTLGGIPVIVEVTGEIRAMPDSGQ